MKCVVLAAGLVIAITPPALAEDAAVSSTGSAHASPWIDTTAPGTPSSSPPDSTSAPSDTNDGAPISPGRRAAAIGAAIFPGVVIHGSGAWVAHERRAAKLLFASELAGGVLLGVAGAFVGGTGGNQYTIWPGVPLVLAGAGLVTQGWFTDVYVAASGRDYDAAPLALPPWSVEAGTSWLHDAYRERALTRASGAVAIGRLELGATGLIDVQGDEKIGNGEARVRLYGPLSDGAAISDGTRVDVRASSGVMRDDSDDVTQWISEIEVMGRLDLSRIDRVFGASFVELSTGLGATRITYAKMEHEWDSILLGRFGWGMYLGHRGEIEAYYDHRRDGLAGGIAAWRAAGFVGSVGANAYVRVHGPWALRTELQIGNAWLTTVAIGYRGGGS